MEKAIELLKKSLSYIETNEYFYEWERGPTSPSTIKEMADAGDMCQLYYDIYKFLKEN